MVLITYGLVAADSENQYITLLFYADSEGGTDQGNTNAVASTASQNVDLSCHGLKSHHQLSAVDMNYLIDPGEKFNTLCFLTN